MASKYDNNGNLNPFWVEEQNYKFDMNREIESTIKMINAIQDNQNKNELSNLEIAHEFLMNHNGSEEELEIALMILKIKNLI